MFLDGRLLRCGRLVFFNAVGVLFRWLDYGAVFDVGIGLKAWFLFVLVYAVATYTQGVVSALIMARGVGFDSRRVFCLVVF